MKLLERSTGRLQRKHRACIFSAEKGLKKNDCVLHPRFENYKHFLATSSITALFCNQSIMKVQAEQMNGMSSIELPLSLYCNCQPRAVARLFDSYEARTHLHAATKRIPQHALQHDWRFLLSLYKPRLTPAVHISTKHQLHHFAVNAPLLYFRGTPLAPTQNRGKFQWRGTRC